MVINYIIIYKQLIHASIKHVLIAYKYTKIPINYKEVEQYYYKLCRIGKSTKIISRLPLALASRLLQYIYINSIEHKPQGHKGLVYFYYYYCAHSRYY